MCFWRLSFLSVCLCPDTLGSNYREAPCLKLKRYRSEKKENNSLICGKPQHESRSSVFGVASSSGVSENYIRVILGEKKNIALINSY